MKAYCTEIDASKSYVVVTIYSSANRKQYDIKVPKYFMGDSKGVDMGTEVVLAVKKKRK